MATTEVGYDEDEEEEEKEGTHAIHTTLSYFTIQ